MGAMSGKNLLVVGGSSGIGLQPGSFAHSVVDVRLPIGDQNPAVPQPLHGLAHSPGSITLGALVRLTEQQFLADFDVNLLGAVRVLTHCLDLCDKSGASVVLFSTVAVRTGFALHAPVASAKGALEGLVRSLAAAEFLLGEDSGWITGPVLPVDGGDSALRIL